MITGGATAGARNRIFGENRMFGGNRKCGKDRKYEILTQLDIVQLKNFGGAASQLKGMPVLLFQFLLRTSI